MRISKESAKTSRAQRGRPQLFARGGRDRVLVCLAVNGPLHVREIARLIGSDSSKTFRMVSYLEECGLIVKRHEPGFRKVAMLNKSLGFLYFQLRDLLLANDARWPVKRSASPFPFYPKTRLRGVATPSDAQFERWFCSVPRSRVLLYVAAVGRTNMSDLALRARVGTVSVLYSVNHWEDEGVLRTNIVGKHRVVELNEDFPLMGELWPVLNAIVQRSKKYANFRKDSVRSYGYVCEMA